MQVGSIQQGQTVLVVDDLIATGEYLMNSEPIIAFTGHIRGFCEGCWRACGETRRRSH